MKKVIVVINGYAESGKDTFCNIVRDYSGYDTYTISSVDRVKEIGEICGANRNDKSEKNRKFWSDLKDLLTWYNDLPMNKIREEVNYFLKSVKKEIMFIHVREPNEIERCKQEFGAKTLLIVNKNVEQITSNHADAGVFDYQYDYIIKNNGTLDDLKEKAINFASKMMNGDANEV